jgi:flap endonuclease-1
VGVVLTPIIDRQQISLEQLRHRVLAVDGHAELYQFLALIRLPDGTPLRDANERITSHLSGLFFRTTRLIAEYGIRPLFVFDGPPHVLKAGTLEERRTIRRRYEEQQAAALARGDFAEAYSKATMTSRLTREMVAEARELLHLLGIPTIQAPGEGEAQAAHMARRGDVWAAASKDYDTLLFGAPRLVRFLTISGKEFLPSQGTFRPIVPEVIELQRQLDAWQITREQFVDLAILLGTDFNEGVKGIGPKKGLRLLRQYGRLEAMPGAVREAAGDVDEVRRIYLAPSVTDSYSVDFSAPDRNGVVDFLCGQRQFSRDRVTAALDRAFREPTLF